MDITAPNPCTHYSPVGIIPKLHQPGRFRLIVDLSSPQGASVNDAIPSDLALLQYPRVEQAIKLIAQHDRGVLIAKLNLQSAYRKIPVHPADQHLLGISWEGATYTNKALPFGLCLEPKVFSAVADGFAWALVAQGFLKFVHCLDDFLFWSSSDSQECLLALQTAIHLGSELSLPPALEKVEGPTTSLMFLGIQVDSVSHQLCLPQTKLRRLKATLLHWSHTKSPMKRQLQSLLGTLHHTVLVVPPGRTFTWELTDNMKCLKCPAHHRTRLTACAKADISWWLNFVDDWNGVGFFPFGSSQPLDHVIMSDASGSWGCGAFSVTTLQYFQLQWPQDWLDIINIAAKELLPMVISAAVWGSSWSHKKILFRCDNTAAVKALSSHSAKDPTMAYLLRCLFFIEA